MMNCKKKQKYGRENGLATGITAVPDCSVLHLLTALQRTRSFRRPPYVASGIKTLMKENFQRVFLSEASQG
jgi:hypothetical protein